MSAVLIVLATGERRQLIDPEVAMPGPANPVAEASVSDPVGPVDPVAATTEADPMIAAAIEALDTEPLTARPVGPSAYARDWAIVRRWERNARARDRARARYLLPRGIR